MHSLKSINPATEEIIKTFDTIDGKKLNSKILIGENAFKNWRATSVKQRTNLFLALAEYLRKEKHRLSHSITLEMGKPISQSIGEIEKCAWLCEYYAENTEEFLKAKPVETDASESYIQYDPLGIILGIMPWNFPFWQVFRFAIPAIAAGNTILVKHAPNVTMTALEIEKLFLEAGFPEGILQVLLIDIDQVEGLISNCHIKGISVTASEHTGSTVASLAGREIKKTVLELGGNDPFIILEDADIEQASEIGAASRLFNSGQTCISAKRFIVINSKYDEFMEKFINNIVSKKIGNPMDSDTDIGPLSRIDIYNNLKRQVDESINMGARIVSGGGDITGKGYFFQPTVLADITEKMPVFTEETFGPVAAVISAYDCEEAISIANDSKYGLGASLWTQDIQLGKQLAHNINAGHVSINSMVKSDPRLSFGGINRSGYGRELSSNGLKEFVNIKSVWIK